MKNLTEVVTDDLKALLFWASVGVRQSKGGAYEAHIENIIESYAKHLKLQLPRAKFLTAQQRGTES
jgi:hypothetical protein